MDLYIGYKNTCRICLKKDEHMKVSIFDTLNKSIRYGDIISMILHPTPLDKNPRLPLKLCQMCKDNLIKIFNLRQLCFTSDRWIKSTIYGVYLNENGFGLDEYPAPNDESYIETMVVDSDDDNAGDENAKQDDINPSLLFSSLQYETPDVLLHDINEYVDEDQPEKQTYRCEVCSQELFTLNGYQRHKLNKHKELNELHIEGNTNKESLAVEQHFCDICHRNYSSRNGYLKHRRRQHKTMDGNELTDQPVSTSLTCEKCNQQFSTINETIAHKMSHDKINKKNELLYICDICNEKYKTFNALRLHKRTVHGNAIAFKCELCNIDFLSNKGLLIHNTANKKHLAMINLLEPDKKYSCRKCGIEFTTIEEFSEHMQQHLFVRMDYKNNVCQLCKRGYKQHRNLSRHKCRAVLK